MKLLLLLKPRSPLPRWLTLPVLPSTHSITRPPRASKPVSGRPSEVRRSLKWTCAWEANAEDAIQTLVSPLRYVTSYLPHHHHHHPRFSLPRGTRKEPLPLWRIWLSFKVTKVKVIRDCRIWNSLYIHPQCRVSKMCVVVLFTEACLVCY